MKANRIKEWVLPKGGFVLGFFLLICSYFLEFNKSDFSFLFGSILTFFSIGFLGYWINDWSDLKTDLVAGKTNLTIGFSTISKLLVFLVLLLLSVFPWIFILPIDNIIVTTLVLQFSLFIIYSCAPIRAKRVPIFGLVLDALYANVIPINLAFYTACLYFKVEFSAVIYTLIIIWSFLYGIRGIIVHHYFDRENDKISGEYNLFNSIHKKLVIKCISFFYLLEIAFRTIALFKLDELLNPKISVNEHYLLLSLIVISLLFSLIDLVNFIRKLPPNPFILNLNDIFNQKIILCCFLIQFGSMNFLSSTISILLFLLIFSFNRWLLFQILKSQLSLIINHFIYEIFYVFRFFLPKSIWKKHLKNWKLTHQKKHKLTIAIFNENKDKYTETFIKGHVEFLPFNKVFYYGKLPVTIFPWGNIFSDNEYLRKLKRIFYDFFGINQRNVFVNQLSRSLKGRKIDVVLAEFGTMGTQVFEACASAGVPLVVVFYGYDAWHKNTIDSNVLKYKGLFSYASKVIGVSLDICQQLQKLGCPKEKIEYLPCYVNLNRFHYIDHSKNPPIILSVGRFSETKSPHLTILAFNEVLKEISDAKLVMVGKDGGGELFEACHILVKALKIEKSVEFKGILTPQEVKLEMDKARVFVQHSITTPINGDKEGTPVSIMEAMACGLPVVATKHAGIAELVTNGENGFLVEEFDTNEMAKQLIFCLKNPEFANRIGKLASESIYSNDLIVNHSKHLEKLLNEINNHSK